jgi:hypothetical protein
VWEEIRVKVGGQRLAARRRSAGKFRRLGRRGWPGTAASEELRSPGCASQIEGADQTVKAEARADLTLKSLLRVSPHTT